MSLRVLALLAVALGALACAGPDREGCTQLAQRVEDAQTVYRLADADVEAALQSIHDHLLSGGPEPEPERTRPVFARRKEAARQLGEVREALRDCLDRALQSEPRVPDPS